MGEVALQSKTTAMRYVMWQIMVKSCAVLVQKLITRLYKPITIHRLHFLFWTTTQP